MRATALLLVLAACTDPLPLYYQVEDLRVLGMRADPPEVLLDGPAEVDVTFSALVVDPRRGAIDWRWQFCPVDSERACLDYEERRDAAWTGYRPILDTLHGITLAGTALPVDEVAPVPGTDWWSTRAAWPYALAPFPVNASPDLYTFHLFDNALGAGQGATPSATLTLTKGAETLIAAKRMVLGVRDARAAAAQLAGQFGVTICDAGQTPETQPGCLLIRDKEPNSHPVFAAVRLARGASPLGEFTDLEIAPSGDVAGPVSLRAGESIRLLPVFTPESSQAFQTLQLDLLSQRLYVEDDVEELSVSWFVTAGRLREAFTWPQWTKTLDTVYIAPDAPPSPDGRASVWLIARDQRGGEAWMSVELSILP